MRELLPTAKSLGVLVDPTIREAFGVQRQLEKEKARGTRFMRPHVIRAKTEIYFLFRAAFRALSHSFCL
jgi:hypothetical protein